MSNWDRITAHAGWVVLIAFTALSSYLNARHVQLLGEATTEAVIFHAAIPAALLVAGLFAELVALSGVHRAAKVVTVSVLVGIFAVTLIASYIAVLAVVTTWNPYAPAWVNQALAAVPDAAMVMAGTVVLSLRVQRHGLAPAPSRTRGSSYLRRLADAAVTRAEAALTIPQNPQVGAFSEGHGGVPETVAEPSTEPVADAAGETGGGVRNPSAEGVAEVHEGARGRSPKASGKPRGGSAKASAKVSVGAELLPFMEAARRLAGAGVVRGKRAEDYAQILHAVGSGWSPTRIKNELGFAQSTTAKVIEAADGERPALTAV